MNSIRRKGLKKSVIALTVLFGMVSAATGIPDQAHGTSPAQLVKGNVALKIEG